MRFEFFSVFSVCWAFCVLFGLPTQASQARSSLENKVSVPIQLTGSVGRTERPSTLIAQRFQPISGAAQQALDLANRDRRQYQLRPLDPDVRLTIAAQYHANDMLQRNYLSHNSPEGVTPSQRFMAVGGVGGAAENILVWQDPALARIERSTLAFFQRQWMSSPGHRRNLLDSRYDRFGYGIAVSPVTKKIYAVQMFALAP